MADAFLRFEQAKPEPKAPRNFTELDSRIMKDGAMQKFVQACNAKLCASLL
jgi:hypothetical protein